MSTEVTSERDSPTPIIRRKTLTARSEGMRTVIDYGEFGRIVTDEPVAHGGTGAGPSPLQAVLGALCGCEAVTFSRTAAELGFEYAGIDFEAEFKIDIRGRLGNRDVRRHFQVVRVVATVETEASEAALRAIVEETEARCPVFNLVHDAGVRCEMRWVRRPPKRRENELRGADRRPGGARLVREPRGS
jgi:uncharacterized OsmC-like protein